MPRHTPREPFSQVEDTLGSSILLFILANVCVIACGIGVLGLPDPNLYSDWVSAAVLILNIYATGVGSMVAMCYGIAVLALRILLSLFLFFADPERFLFGTLFRFAFPF
jgi:hypothetical protein